VIDPKGLHLQVIESVIVVDIGIAAALLVFSPCLSIAEKRVNAGNVV
jgi:hypothetical protein